MATLTYNALNDIEREKDYSPETILSFLRESENFVSVPVGIKRELTRLGFTGSDEDVLNSFKNLLQKVGFNKDERKHARNWLIDGRLPSPRYGYPIRLCFAFGLKGQAALDFLWKVCRVNGFNFRRAEDIVYCYCLENDKTYSEAISLLDCYKKHTEGDQRDVSEATKRTHMLRSMFGELAGMDEGAFFELLCENKKNFLNYSVTAHEEILKNAEHLKSTLTAQIADYNNWRERYALLQGYDHSVSLYPEIIFAFDFISKAAKNDTSPLADIMDRFPQERYLSDMFRLPTEATDKEHDRARKAFVLLYFADYALDPPPNEFFGDFVIALNELLDRCGFAKLYPANPFDWLVLKSIRSLDHVDQELGDNPIELFNEVLVALAEEQSA